MALKNEPTYVKKFKCSNRYCTDTCCHGFDIELDEKSLDVYNNFTGELKDLVQEGVFHRNQNIIFEVKMVDASFWMMIICVSCKLSGEKARCVIHVVFILESYSNGIMLLIPG